MPTKITTLTVNELGQASASKAAAAAAEASATAAAASAAAALAAENSLLEWKGPWVTATAYAPSDLVEENGNTYVCVVPHTSGTFSTDLGNSYWEIFAAKGDTGPGSGDLLAANNLSDVASIPTARANLGISTFGATLIDDADAATARTTLGLGTAAVTSYTVSESTSTTNNKVWDIAATSASTVSISAAQTVIYKIGGVYLVQGKFTLGAALTTGAAEEIGLTFDGLPDADSLLAVGGGTAWIEDVSATTTGLSNGMTSFVLRHGEDETGGQFTAGLDSHVRLLGSASRSYASGDIIEFNATFVEDPA